MAKQEFSIPALMKRLPDENSAYLLMEDLRWHGQPVCHHCGSTAKHYFLKPQDAEGRRTRTGAVSHRRVWKCKSCRKQFSVLTGTIFHGTKIPLRTWSTRRRARSAPPPCATSPAPPCAASSSAM